MKTLSIIIPSYNTSKFIDKNIKTFIDSRLFNDVEVLIVNDGSKDDTAEKAQYYSNRYPGYIRLINKENGNHGSAINVGVRIAKGRYFKVVDADDWVDTENLIKLAFELKKTEVDLVINPYFKIDEKSGKKQRCGYKIFEKNRDEISFENMIDADLQLAIQSVTYKTSVFIDHDIYLTEKCFYEDFQFTMYPIPFINTVKVLDYSVYYYLVGQKSQSVNAENALKNVNMYLTVYKDAMEYYSNNRHIISKKTNEYIMQRLCVFIKSLYHIYLRNSTVSNINKNFMKTDEMIKAVSLEMYHEVGKSRYIVLMRTGRKFIFVILGKLFAIYKSKEIS